MSMCSISEDDREFLDKFEKCTLSGKCWTHEAHIRMAWLRMEQSDSFEEALDRIRSGIKAFNSSVQSVGYHETITVAFARVIHSKRRLSKGSSNWQAFLEENEVLLSKNCLLEFYSAELLKSDEARHFFVEPDLKPLPQILESGRI
ncbi:MAG: hypothetical protein K2Z81_18835 [Cyanobacteria bacterium]|nr:hypothetical protein [Cyanobacteriota bacterium]